MQLEKSVSSLRFVPFRSVLGTSVFSTLYTHGVQCSPNHVVADTRKVFDAATANEHHRVLLQIVSNTWNIGRYLNSIG